MMKSGKSKDKQKRKSVSLKPDVILPKKIVVIERKEERNNTYTKLIVKNLKFDVTKKNLKELFVGAKLVKIPKFTDTGRAKGFAFVFYENKSDALEVEKEKNRSELNGRMISIQLDRRSEVTNDDSKTPSPRKPDVYRNKKSSLITGPKKMYTLADDSD